MKRFTTPILFALGGFAIALLLPLYGQTTQVPASEVQRLVLSLQQQNITLKSNQDKIEEKIATLEEELRQARIYVGRSGRGGTQ